MPAIFTDTQLELAAIGASMGADGRAAHRAVLDGAALPEEPTRSLMDGFAGLGVPEDRGGAGGTLTDLVVLVEALGRTMVPTPFTTHVAAVQTAVAAGLDVEAAALGRELWTVALAERAGSGWGAWAATFGSPATGTKVGVPHGADADVLVAAGAEDRVALVVPAATQPRTCLDPSLRTADVDLAMCTVRSDAPGARVALARAAVVLAADLAGVGKGALGLGAEYASVREQFNQPIGRFQGVSHQLADAFVEIEAGWNLVLYASWALDAGTADAVSMAHAALAKTGAAAVHAAERTLQVHGGIGVTWEGDPHLYIRRALALNAVLGGHAAHAREVGRSLVGSA